MPGDLVGGVALEIGRVEMAPQRLLGAFGHGVEPQQPLRFDLARGHAVLDRHAGRAAASSTARVAWNRSSSSLAFHAFHTLGLVPRMSATVSR